MRRLTRLLAVVPALALTLAPAVLAPAIAAGAVAPCDDVDLTTRMDEADAVFVGEAIRFNDARDGGTGFAVTVFRVSDVFKGDVTEEQAIVTVPGDPDAPVFDTSRPYLVVASASSAHGELEPGFYAADRCGSGFFVDVDADVVFPNPPAPPAEGKPTDAAISAQIGNPRSSLFPEMFIFAGVIVFVVALTAWLNRSGRSVTLER